MLYCGLGIYIREDLNYKIIHICQPSDIFESQFIEISSPRPKNKKIILGNIYSPPRNVNDNYFQFFDEFQTYLQALNAKNHPVIVAGYFNIDLLQISTEPAFMEIFQMINSCAFIPKLTFPLR